MATEPDRCIACGQHAPTSDSMCAECHSAYQQHAADFANTDPVTEQSE